jgi:23S rRNA (uracil1939-C5)-methyltransferase
MIDKNKTYECEITDLTVSGDGVAKIDAYPLFVNGAIPGDKIIMRPTKLNKTYGFGKMIKLLKPSFQRRNPPCRYQQKEILHCRLRRKQTCKGCS